MYIASCVTLQYVITRYTAAWGSAKGAAEPWHAICCKRKKIRLLCVRSSGNVASEINTM